MSFSKKLVCAPMATLSHEAFRRAIEKFGGVDEYFTEMINAPSLLNMGPFEKYYIQNGPCPEKIVWQLTGNKAESIAKAALVVASLGGLGVDLNMGCCAPQIYKTGAGISWMLKPLNETREMVRLVKNALTDYEKQSGVHQRLSVKCRLGKDDFTDEDFFSFTDMLVEEGVELITLHPRTLKEKYRMSPRYAYVQKLCDRYKNAGVEIYANGAVSDWESAKKVESLCPDAGGIMIGRAAAQKPWIFREILNAGEGGEKITFNAEDFALDFISDVEKYQPKEFHKTRLQRFFTYYCMNFSFGHYFQTQMINASSTDDSRERVRDYFSKQESERFISF